MLLLKSTLGFGDYESRQASCPDASWHKASLDWTEQSASSRTLLG